MNRDAILNPVMGESLWYVSHVKPRCEKKLVEYCTHHGITSELPLRQETKIYQRRRVTVQKPVFPGYAFLFD